MSAFAVWVVAIMVAAVVFLLGWTCRGLVYEQRDNRQQTERDRAWDRAHLKESGDD